MGFLQRYDETIDPAYYIEDIRIDKSGAENHQFLSHPIDPLYYIEDCRILCLLLFH